MPKNVKSCMVKFVVFSLIGILSSQAELAAQVSPIWGKLQPGPHRIGFQTFEEYDYSRTFRPKRDYFGAQLPGERARPIQICVWYPARPAVEDVEITYGEYVFPNPEDPDFYAFLSGLQRRELLYLISLPGSSGGLVLDAMSVGVAAVRNAPPEEGQFPLLLYFPDVGRGLSDNLVLCEYLASHGFVVATTNSAGMADMSPTADQADLETLIRDREFALAHLRDLDFVDKDRLGVLGRGFGGLAALIMQMRNYDIDAVAGLDAWSVLREHLEFATLNPNFNAGRMITPLLQIYYKDEPTSDLALLDSCKYADRYLAGFENRSEDDLSSYGAIRQLLADSVDLTLAISRPSYDLACRHTRDFFKAHLEADEASRASLTATGTTTFKSGQDLPPTTDQFLAIIRNQGADRAVEIWDKFKESDPGSITVPEATLNAAGYQMLQSGRSEEAVKLFRINAESYPGSANCWDSYADGLIAIGDHEGAIRCYKKVLEVLPTDQAADESLKQTLRTNAEQGLLRLEG
ncbi:MAG: hypothetical protein OEW00_12335 [candidate division Zixibacteria bacterium]|nr:hypothetical protein [candidate division Zixibacteria bacterium]